MLSDYESLRFQQVRHLDDWYNNFVVPARREKGHHNFSLDFREISNIRLMDLYNFAVKNEMTFEFENFTNSIIFRDVKR